MKHRIHFAALALALAAAPALAKKPAVQILPKGQLYEQRDVDRSKAQCLRSAANWRQAWKTTPPS